MIRGRRCSRHAFQPLKDFFPTREPRFFSFLNRLEHGHVLQAFVQCIAQEILAFFENLDDSIFQEDFDAAFFKHGHADKLGKAVQQVKRRDLGMDLSQMPIHVPRSRHSGSLYLYSND